MQVTPLDDPPLSLADEHGLLLRQVAVRADELLARGLRRRLARSRAGGPDDLHAGGGPAPGAGRGATAVPRLFPVAGPGAARPGPHDAAPVDGSAGEGGQRRGTRRRPTWPRRHWSCSPVSNATSSTRRRCSPRTPRARTGGGRPGADVADRTAGPGAPRIRRAGERRRHAGPGGPDLAPRAGEDQGRVRRVVQGGGPVDRAAQVVRPRPGANRTSSPVATGPSSASPNGPPHCNTSATWPAGSH